MSSRALRSLTVFAFIATTIVLPVYSNAAEESEIGREVAIPHHLQDGDEFDLPIKELLAYGKKLFEARFTAQEGAGRPLSKGTGAPLSDPNSPLLFPRNNNRLSGRIRTPARAVITSRSAVARAIFQRTSSYSVSDSIL